MNKKFIPEEGVVYAPVYFYIGVDMEAHSYIKDPYTEDMYAMQIERAGNCFKNKDEAEEYASIIRKILSRDIAEVKKIFEEKHECSDSSSGSWIQEPEIGGMRYVNNKEEQL